MDLLKRLGVFSPFILLCAYGGQENSQDEVVQNALKYLVSQQREDGSWCETGMEFVEALKTGGKLDVNHLARSLHSSALCGLALYASGSNTKEGPFKDSIQKASQALSLAIEKEPDRRWDKIALLSYPAVAIFLSHVYKDAKSDQIKNVLQMIRDKLLKLQKEDGGWGYWGGGGMPFNTTPVIIALACMKHVGIDVDIKVVEKAQSFYTGIQQKDGGFPYGGRDKDYKYHSSEPGRSVASLFAMKLLGLEKKPEFGKAISYSKKWLTKVHASYDGPSFHILYSGLACYLLEDQTYWKEFKEHYSKQIAGNQSKDGSILFKTNDKPSILECKPGTRELYTTPHYAIILQLDKENLFLKKMGNIIAE